MEAILTSNYIIFAATFIIPRCPGSPITLPTIALPIELQKPFGLGPAPFLLGATVEHHLKHSSSNWAEILIFGSYVDNYLIPIENREELKEATYQIRSCFGKPVSIAGNSCPIAQKN